MSAVELQPTPQSQATNAYDLLTDVIRFMEEEPRRVDMGDWIRDVSWKLDAGYYDPTAPSCGTMGCFAGWILVAAVGRECALASPRSYLHNPVGDRAMEVLGADPFYREQDRESYDFSVDLDRAFQSELKEEYREVLGTKARRRLDPGTPEYVALVVHRIRKFQAKWEKRLRDTPVSRDV